MFTDSSASHNDSTHRSQAHQPGCIIHGLSLQGARWDDEGHCMAPPRLADGLTSMPSMRLRPVPGGQASDLVTGASSLELAASTRLSTGTDMRAREFHTCPSDCSQDRNSTVQVCVEVFETDARGRDAPAIASIHLPAANYHRASKACPRSAGISGRPGWVMQNAALVCNDQPVVKHSTVE